MKAKLIKDPLQGDYVLSDGSPIAIGITGKIWDGIYKLSLKNCQAIERGYDLDELAEFYSTMTVFIKKDEIPTEKQIEDAEYVSEIAFKAGFQKALELMEHRLSKETEWQVEVVMDICGDRVYAVPEPALDEHGCLILKRIDD